MINTYFSGQGCLYLARYTSEGKLEDFFDVGNSPVFTITKDTIEESKLRRDKNYTPRMGSVKIVFDNFNEDTLGLIFGGKTSSVVELDFPQAGGFADKKYSKVLRNAITQRVDGTFALVFEGLNTANSNKNLRLTLGNVWFQSAKSIRLISDEIERFEIEGEYLHHTNNSVYLFNN